MAETSVETLVLQDHQGVGHSFIPQTVAQQTLHKSELFVQPLTLGIQKYRRILTDLKEIYNVTGPSPRSPHIRMACTVPVFPLRMVSTVPWTLPMTTTWSGDGQQPPPQRTFT